MLIKDKYLSIAGCMLCSTVLYAGTSGVESLRDPSNCANAYVFTLSGGPAYTSLGKSQTFNLQSDIEKTYTADRKVRARASGEIFLGLQQYLEEGLASQIGVAFALNHNKVSGQIREDAQPEFQDFNYEYSVQNQRYLFKGKFIADTVYGIQSYLSAGAGIASNRSRSFSITPLIFQAVPAPLFGANTEISFSYTLGAGIQKPVTKNIQIGVGYEFADWGRNTLARAPGQTLNDGLGLSHLYTNQLQFLISFLA